MPTRTIAAVVRAVEVGSGPGDPQPDASAKGRQPPAPTVDRTNPPDPHQSTAPGRVTGYVHLKATVDGCQIDLHLWPNGADTTTTVRVLNALQGTLDALESHRWDGLRLKPKSPR